MCALEQLFQLAPLVDVYHLLRTGTVPNTRVKIGRNSPMIGLFSVHRLKLMEGLLESVPQAVLQVRGASGGCDLVPTASLPRS